MDIKMVKEQEVGSRWRATDWDKVMGPERARADHYFMRSGLIRKDLLPRFAGKHSPPTFVASTVAQLDALLEAPGADDDERPGCLNPRAILAGRREGGVSRDVYVIKYADSSNAFGIQFAAAFKPDAADAIMAAAAAA